MSGTISTTISNGYDLTVIPTTITATGVVTSTDTVAVRNGGTINQYTLFNYGIVAGPTNYAGVDLTSGGELVNEFGATITGKVGVQIEATGVLINAGSIVSNGSAAAAVVSDGSNTVTGVIVGYDGLQIAQANGSFENAGTISGTGTSAAGVLALAGGTLVNAYGGLIKGVYGVIGTASLTNAGTIFGTGSIASGVRLLAGGDLMNEVSGTIIGNEAVLISGVGYLSNAGTIISNQSGGIAVGTNFGSNASTGLIQGGLELADAAASFVNSGIITGYFAADGYGGGTMVNTAGGLIDGAFGVDGMTSVSNAGTIIGSNVGVIIYRPSAAVSNDVTGLIDRQGQSSGSNPDVGNDAILFRYAGRVLNAGTIVGGSLGAAADIRMYGIGGYVQNMAAGLISNQTGVALRLENGADTVINAGQILTLGSIAIDLTDSAGGVIINRAAGTISGLAGGISADAAEFVTNAGSIGSSEGYGVDLEGGGTLISSGTITGAETAAYLGGSLANRVVLEAGAAFGGMLLGGTTASNTLELAVGGGTLASGFANFATITFDADADWTLLGGTAAFAGQIIGFELGDTLALGGLIADGGVYAGGVLTLTADGADVGTIELAGDVTDGFTVLAETNETVVSVACYLAGTRIATPDGERSVKGLAVGDLVLTASGTARPIRWIGHRIYDARFADKNPLVQPVTIRAGALADGIPVRDLSTSPKHAMLLDGMLIPAELLVNGVSVVRAPATATIAYWHVELDSHDILLAEGAPSESFVDRDSRSMFHNAPEFFARYGQVPPRPDCAKRVEDGVALATIRRRIATRAGLAADHASDAVVHGPLDGRIESFDHRHVTGWAFDAGRPHTAVALEVLVDGVRAAAGTANVHRADLQLAGKGEGRCAFALQLPEPLSADVGHALQVRRCDDGTILADLVLAADPATPGTLAGHVDTCNGTTVEGWALDTAHPATPVRLEVLAGEIVLGEVLANRYRPDLAAAGKANGWCSFVFRLEPTWDEPGPIRVRRAGDDMMLATPVVCRKAA